MNMVINLDLILCLIYTQRGMHFSNYIAVDPVNCSRPEQAYLCAFPTDWADSTYLLGTAVLLKTNDILSVHHTQQSLYQGLLDQERRCQNIQRKRKSDPWYGISNQRVKPSTECLAKSGFVIDFYISFSDDSVLPPTISQPKIQTIDSFSYEFITSNFFNDQVAYDKQSVFIQFIDNYKQTESVVKTADRNLIAGNSVIPNENLFRWYTTAMSEYTKKALATYFDMKQPNMVFVDYDRVTKQHHARNAAEILQNKKGIAALAPYRRLEDFINVQQIFSNCIHAEESFYSKSEIENFADTFTEFSKKRKSNSNQINSL